MLLNRCDRPDSSTTAGGVGVAGSPAGSSAEACTTAPGGSGVAAAATPLVRPCAGISRVAGSVGDSPGARLAAGSAESGDRTVQGPRSRSRPAGSNIEPAGGTSRESGPERSASGSGTGSSDCSAPLGVPSDSGTKSSRGGAGNERSLGADFAGGPAAGFFADSLGLPFQASRTRSKKPGFAAADEFAARRGGPDRAGAGGVVFAVTALGRCVGDVPGVALCSLAIAPGDGWRETTCDVCRNPRGCGVGSSGSGRCSTAAGTVLGPGTGGGDLENGQRHHEVVGVAGGLGVRGAGSRLTRARTQSTTPTRPSVPPARDEFRASKTGRGLPDTECLGPCMTTVTASTYSTNMDHLRADYRPWVEQVSPESHCTGRTVTVWIVSTDSPVRFCRK
jgi:hypothetical protein